MIELYERQHEELPENSKRSWVALMKPAADLANAIAGTDFVPARIRQNPGAIAACVLYGDEVGLGPMQSLAKISVIEGTPSLAAEAMRALILAAGHELWFEEQTVSRVTIVGRRRESQQQTKVTWTLDDARRAGLAGRANWRTYPRHMLAARATSELAGLIFADVIGGLRSTEELEEGDEASMPAGASGEPRRGNDQKRRRERPSPRMAAAPRPEGTSSGEGLKVEQRELPPLPGEAGYEPGSDEPTEAQRRALHAEFRSRGLDRDQRLAWVGHFLGREISSFNDLTAREHSRLLERLNENDIPYGVPDEQPEQPDEPEETATLSLAIFKARLAGERFGRQMVSEVGRELYPGRSLEQLTDEERAKLMEQLLERRGEVDWE